MRLLHITYEASSIDEFVKILKKNGCQTCYTEIKKSVSGGGIYYAFICDILSSAVMKDGREAIYTQRVYYTNGFDEKLGQLLKENTRDSVLSHQKALAEKGILSVLKVDMIFPTR